MMNIFVESISADWLVYYTTCYVYALYILPYIYIHIPPRLLGRVIPYTSIQYPALTKTSKKEKEKKKKRKKMTLHTTYLGTVLFYFVCCTYM